MTEHRVTSCDTALRALRRRRVVDCLPWRGIAALSQYSPIPAGTLCRWYHTGYLPPKWYKRLGIPRPVEIEPCQECGQIHAMNKTCSKDKRTRHRIAISKTDPVSAARSIERCYFSKEDLIRELEELI